VTQGDAHLNASARAKHAESMMAADLKRMVMETSTDEVWCDRAYSEVCRQRAVIGLMVCASPHQVPVGWILLPQNLSQGSETSACNYMAYRTVISHFEATSEILPHQPITSLRLCRHGEVQAGFEVCERALNHGTGAQQVFLCYTRHRHSIGHVNDQHGSSSSSSSSSKGLSRTTRHSDAVAGDTGGFSTAPPGNQTCPPVIELFEGESLVPLIAIDVVVVADPPCITPLSGHGQGKARFLGVDVKGRALIPVGWQGLMHNLRHDEEVDIHQVLGDHKEAWFRGIKAHLDQGDASVFEKQPNTKQDCGHIIFKQAGWEAWDWKPPPPPIARPAAARS
jgi:hypothetical protein